MTQDNTRKQKLNPASKVVQIPAKSTSNELKESHQFNQSIILRQSPFWSRAIVWTIVGVTTFGILWASIAKIENAIPAQGQLEPQGAVKEVQAPVGGVVADIHVKDGQSVNAGDILISFDTGAAQAQLSSLQKVRATLTQENQFYRNQLGSQTPITGGQLLPEIALITQNRAALIAENRLYRAQFKGSVEGENLSFDQQTRWQSNQLEFNSRVDTAQLEITQLERQLEQNRIQLANARERWNAERRIAQDLKSLVDNQAFSRIQYSRQEQEVNTRMAAVDQLVEEQSRLQSAIAQARSKVQTTVAVSKNDSLNKIAENDKKIAEIDSLLNKAIVENEKKIADLNSQITQAQQVLQYKELKAEEAGIVFDLKAYKGFVANPSQTILKIVPEDALIAKVFITNKDIGFVSNQMQVDVRIDSFPFSEFGDIKGEVVELGSDVLPPDQTHPFYRFPAKIKLKSQFIKSNHKELKLQSGMSVSVNIKSGDRTVISLFTEFLTKKFESLKQPR